MKSGLCDNMRKLVTLIDDLLDVGVQDYISLPKICVLGMQSAGKSSLLENIVGLDFLPRGEVYILYIIGCCDSKTIGIEISAHIIAVATLGDI